MIPATAGLDELPHHPSASLVPPAGNDGPLLTTLGGLLATGPPLLAVGVPMIVLGRHEVRDYDAPTPLEMTASARGLALQGRF